MANLPELVDILNVYFRQHASEIWLEKLDQEGVPAGPILTIEEMLEHPQALARDMVVQTEHERAGKSKGLEWLLNFMVLSLLRHERLRSMANIQRRY